ncbi:hypothetical protein [Nannocystis punicea]|uniref:Uncharacterized protein n=1 Tax=Nannocystis punicea TaxID=2995304 RepID=A0ABY7H6B1_9BACT|nr:hypothetical protein [Nannocystis poenicansa]WAS94828.1 hypothetical protein O0S08_01595 [Nannocystis poenicansa]
MKAPSEVVALDLRVVIRRVVVRLPAPQPGASATNDTVTGSLVIAAHDASRRRR